MGDSLSFLSEPFDFSFASFLFHKEKKCTSLSCFIIYASDSEAEMNENSHAELWYFSCASKKSTEQLEY